MTSSHESRRFTDVWVIGPRFVGPPMKVVFDGVPPAS
jgi:hypothetical protein